MSFQFSQNNQTNFNNTTTQKDPYPTWMPKYIVQEGDDFWKIARKMYPNLSDDKIAIKVEQLRSVNKDFIDKRIKEKGKETLNVGDVLVNLRFVEATDDMQKSFSKKTASVFDTVGKGTKKSLDFLSGKEDKTKNKAVKSMKANPQETQAKKTGSETASNAVKNTKVEEEDNWFDKMSNTLREWDNSLESTKGDESNITRDWGIEINKSGAKDGMDKRLPQAKKRMHFDAEVLDWLQAGDLSLPELQLSRENKWSTVFEAFDKTGTIKDGIIDLKDFKDERETNELQDAELEKPLKEMMALYTELGALGYSNVGLNKLSLQTGEKVQNFEQIKSDAEKNQVFIREILFKGVDLANLNDKQIANAGNLSTGAMIKLLKVIKQKGRKLTIDEYKTTLGL